MTNREFYQTVATGTINEEVITKANELIAKMDAQNAARREKVSKKALENAPLVAKVVEMLGTEPLTATDIAAALEVSPQKASALARIAVAQGAAALAVALLLASLAVYCGGKVDNIIMRFVDMLMSKISSFLGKKYKKLKKIL